MEGNDALRCLVGDDLDTVSFVRDYVEFRIDDNVLRVFVPPQIVLPDRQAHRFPEDGSRDALCSLISTTITSAAEVDAERESVIVLRNDQGSVVTIPIGLYYGTGTEGAQLVPADKRGRPVVSAMYVW